MMYVCTLHHQYARTAAARQVQCVPHRGRILPLQFKPGIRLFVVRCEYAGIQCTSIDIHESCSYTFLMAKDIIHEAVKRALIKDGWAITHDPFTIRYQTITLSADLGAERAIAAERAGQKIVVEIKSFVGLSPIQDFKLALGQYVLYKGFLEVTDPERKLYLAVNHLVYHDFLQQEAIALIRQRYQVCLITVNVASEEITQWIDEPNIAH